jgi:hypothetical protein
VLFLFELSGGHVLCGHSLLEALDGALHFFLPRLRLLLLLHHLCPLGLVDAFELAVLARKLPLHILQRLNLLLFFVRTFLELGLLGKGIVKARIEDLDLLLSLCRLVLCLL